MCLLKARVFSCALTLVVLIVPLRSDAQSNLIAPALLDLLGKPSDPQAKVALPSLSHISPIDPSAPQTNQPIYACACGCGAFKVATRSMFPRGQGGMAWVEWDYQNQNQNRSESSEAPAAENDDQKIRTHFVDLGFEYFFDRGWGVQVEVPVDYRHFAGSDGSTNWTALGDMRIKGIYTGFSEDQSLGIDFGVKLASGNFTHPGADRDTQVGTGSTDLLLGCFYRTNLSADHNWNFYTQIETDLPVIMQDDYRPGFEADGAAGIYYSGFSFHRLRVSPVGQVIVSYRSSDGGDNSAHPVASGYERVLLSPGIEFDYDPFSLYGDFEIPVYQYFKGDQLAAPALFKVVLSYHF